MHAPFQQQGFLAKLFRLVKPGGYYIIDDIAYTNKKSRHFLEKITLLTSECQEMLYNNDAIFVDTHMEHRDWKKWLTLTRNAKDHVVHNSYLMVIRKRHTAPRPVQINLRAMTMFSGKVIHKDQA